MLLTEIIFEILYIPSFTSANSFLSNVVLAYFLLYVGLFWTRLVMTLLATTGAITLIFYQQVIMAGWQVFMSFQKN